MTGRAPPARAPTWACAVSASPRSGSSPSAAAPSSTRRGSPCRPGFIDVHSHDDFAVLLDPQMAFKVMQGVTTDVVGNCGSGIMPFESGRERFRRFHPGADPPRWDGFAGYMARIDEAAPSCNVAVLIGHGTLRHGAMGLAQRAPERGRARPDAGLGARGRRCRRRGPVHRPDLRARPLRAPRTRSSQLARELGADGGLYATHMRNEAEGLLDAVAEAIRVGEDGGVPVQISHHKASGRDNWGLVERSLALIDQARARGLDVTADQYPYIAGSTSLAAIVQNGALSHRQPGRSRARVGRGCPDRVCAEDARVGRAAALGARPAVGSRGRGGGPPRDRHGARRLLRRDLHDGRGRRAPRDGAPDHHDRLRRRARRRQAAPAPLRHVSAGARPLRERGARPRPADGHPPHDGDAGGEVQARRPRPSSARTPSPTSWSSTRRPSPTPPPTKTPSASPPASAPSTSTAPGSPTTAPTRAPAPAARSAATTS